MTPSRALSNSQIARAALVVLVGFLASGVLGLVRTAIISATFGTGDALDAFFWAQQLPELIFVLVAGGRWDRHLSRCTLASANRTTIVRGGWQVLS